MFAALRKFEQTRPFTDDEAWLLFRLAAFSEAIGWTLLITGIVLKQYFLHGNNTPVLIAGQFHGTLFLLYAAAALGLYPSLGWKRRTAIVAAIASVPPYGSLIFEMWAAHYRADTYARQLQHLSSYYYLSELAANGCSPETYCQTRT